MNGTEWTEPGQGANGQELWTALRVLRNGDGPLREAARGVRASWSIYSTARTNLRLTGHPLTADDLKRIEQCEVTR
jgi:hypothetical protein